LDFLADPVGLEFRQDVVQPLLGDFHLVERLRGGEPSGGAKIGLLHRETTPRLRSERPMAARAASPPLSPRAGSARSSACAIVSVVSMPFPSASFRSTDMSISARAD